MSPNLKTLVSVMVVTTYCGELRQLVPLFQILFEKPGENADNVHRALIKIDQMLLEHFGTEFKPKNWTLDNSGALENGIIRAKGTESKLDIRSDKLHDHNNIQRVIRKVPLPLQNNIKNQIYKMINGTVPNVSENIYECLLVKAKGFQDKTLMRSLMFNYRKRTKYWFCYRQVLDNNATSEQQNRVMTRHGKMEGLVRGVTKMVRDAIADKAKFKLAADGRMVSRGPTVKERKIRVENYLINSLPDVVSSIEEEVLTQEACDDDDYLKTKALEDFKPKSSDTHRSDKRRMGNKKTKPPSKNNFKKNGFLKAKKCVNAKGLSVISSNVSDDEVLVVFKSEVGLENTVTVTQEKVHCTCIEHDKNYFCPELVNCFKVLKLDHLTRNLNFSEEEFLCIRICATELLSVPTDVKRKEWKMKKFKRKIMCSKCKDKIDAGSLVGMYRNVKFHCTRVCLPPGLNKVNPAVDCSLNEADHLLLKKNGIQV